jgi:transposase
LFDEICDSQGKEAGSMVKGVVAAGKLEHFAPTPWTEQSPEWQVLEQRLPEDHLARRVARAVEELDVSSLFASYLGAGKKALRPDLLLKLVLYEMHHNRPSPAQWARDVRDSEAVRWLVFGMEPSRSRLYDFRDRLAPFLSAWHAQVLQAAMQEEMTTAQRAALDSSSVAACAARRQLVNRERLARIIHETPGGR